MINLRKYLNIIKKPSILNDFFIAISAIMLAAIVLIGWLGYEKFRNVNDLTLASVKIEHKITNDLDAIEYQMEYISTQIKQKGTNPFFIYELLKSFQLDSNTSSAPNWNMFSWINEDKLLTIDGDAGMLFKPRRAAHRDYLQKTIDNPGKFITGKTVHGLVSGQLIIPSSMGVVNKGGKYVGSVAFGFDVKDLALELEELVREQYVEFGILDVDGEVIFSSTNFKKSVGLKLRTGKILGVTNKRYPIEIVTYKNKGIGKGVGGQIISDGRNLPILQIIGISFIIILLLFFLKRRIISPIVHLSRIATAVSRGDTDIEIPRYVGVEANRLARSLNRVKKYIKRERRLKNDLRKAQSKANTANIEKTRLLQSTSHDLRNYISSISGILNYIVLNQSKDAIKNSQDLSDLKLVASQSNELMHFVEDLLDINQIENNDSLVHKFEDCDLKDLIGRLVILNKNLLIQNKILLTTHFDDDLPELKCDIKRVKQILMNLISNAVKYSPDNSNIAISASYSRRSNKISLIVEDEGFGMTQEEIKMALNGDGAMIDKSEIAEHKDIDCHGVGMPQIKKLVKMHKGELVIESQKGKGTKITILFPMDNKIADANKTKILVIEKIKSNFLLAKELLEERIGNDIIVEIAASKKEASTIIKSRRFDLILNKFDKTLLGNVKIIPLFESNAAMLSIQTDKKPQRNQKQGLEVFVRNVCQLIGIKNKSIIEKPLDEVKNILKGKKILIAEDELPNQMILRKYLSKFHLKIDIVKNGSELVEKFTNNHKEYDLVLSDIYMPLVDGLSASNQIRQFEEENNLKPTPIIAYSGDGEKEAIKSLFYAGMNDYFTKGSSSDDLVKMLAFWV